MMGMWYTSAEQPLRLEAYYCTANPIPPTGGKRVGRQESRQVLTMPFLEQAPTALPPCSAGELFPPAKRGFPRSANEPLFPA